jgi:hypothetical protein
VNFTASRAVNGPREKSNNTAQSAVESRAGKVGGCRHCEIIELRHAHEHDFLRADAGVVRVTVKLLYRGFQLKRSRRNHLVYHHVLKISHIGIVGDCALKIDKKAAVSSLKVGDDTGRENASDGDLKPGYGCHSRRWSIDRSRVDGITAAARCVDILRPGPGYVSVHAPSERRKGHRTLNTKSGTVLRERCGISGFNRRHEAASLKV